MATLGNMAICRPRYVTAGSLNAYFVHKGLLLMTAKFVWNFSDLAITAWYMQTDFQPLKINWKKRVNEMVHH